MRKLFYVLFAFIALTVTAQAQETKKEKTYYYVSTGLSVAANLNGGDFATNSYGTIEFGLTKNNVSYGLAVGRGQLSGGISRNIVGYETVFIDETMTETVNKPIYGNDIRNYFWEVRLLPSFPLGQFTGSLILGAGSYFATSGAGFFEYGLGVSKTYGNITYGLSYSNWDTINYVTPSVTYNF